MFVELVDDFERVSRSTREHCAAPDPARVPSRSNTLRKLSHDEPRLGYELPRVEQTVLTAGDNRRFAYEIERESGGKIFVA